MIVQLFFLTLFTVSNCRPSDPDYKTSPGTVWNETHCICNGRSSADPIEESVSFEGSGTSESADVSDESSESEPIDECGPGDDCSDHSKHDSIDEIISFEVSGTSESVDVSDESSESEPIDECGPGDDCKSIAPTPRIAINPPLNKTCVNTSEPCNSSACCCSTNIINSNVTINVHNSSITTPYSGDCKNGSIACCCSKNIINSTVVSNISDSYIKLSPD